MVRKAIFTFLTFLCTSPVCLAFQAFFRAAIFTSRISQAAMCEWVPYNFSNTLREQQTYCTQSAQLISVSTINLSFHELTNLSGLFYEIH